MPANVDEQAPPLRFAPVGTTERTNEDGAPHPLRRGLPRHLPRKRGRKSTWCAAILACVLQFGLGLGAHAELEPQTVFHQRIAALPGYKVDQTSKIAVATDGTVFLLIANTDRENKKPTIIEFIRVDRDSKVHRTMLATLKVTSEHDVPDLFRGLLQCLPNEELLIVSTDADFSGNPYGSILRMAPDGTVRHRARLSYPHDFGRPLVGDDSHYEIRSATPTTDRGVVLGGNWGIGPSSWWWGKFTVDGVRLGEFTAPVPYPAGITDVIARPKGAFSILVQDLNASASTTDLVLMDYSATGQRLNRTVVIERAEGAFGKFASDGRIVVVDGRSGGPPKVSEFDSKGKASGEHTLQEGSDSSWSGLNQSGNVFLVSSTEANGLVAQFDRTGAVAWKSPKGNYIAVSPVGDDLWTLVLEADRTTVSVVRLSHP